MVMFLESGYDAQAQTHSSNFISAKFRALHGSLFL